MFPSGNGPGQTNNMYSQPYMQPSPPMLTTIQPIQPNQQSNPMDTNMSQFYQNQFPPLYHPINPQVPTMSNINTNQIHSNFQYNPNQINYQVPISEMLPSSSSDEEILENEDNEATSSHTWQEVRSRKRKRTTRHISIENVTQTKISNKFQPLNEEDTNENLTNDKNPNNKTERTQFKEPRPPPIYVYGVTNYNEMVDSIAQTTPDETYYTRTLPDKVVKINAITSETYRKLIRYFREEKVIHHSYQLKQERAYRIVLRGLHHSVPLEDIKAELAKKGHIVRNIINVRHRTTKEPLPLFFVDLEPNNNNKEIFNIEFIQNTKIGVEPPRHKADIVQCTRCQAYGHSKTYCYKKYKCVKCGGSHDTKICTKPKNTPATCALCNGSHPANYKGCSVYRDLIKTRNKDHTNHIPRQTASSNNTSQVGPLNIQHPLQNTNSYAHVVSGNKTNSSEDLATTMATFLQEFKNLFNQLLNQNGMILNMLTTVINKLAK